MRAEDLIANHVLPLASFRLVDGGYKPVRICGTAFTFGEGTLVTCWHCVSAPLPADEVYAAAVREGGIYTTGYTHALPIELLARDQQDSDLALGRVAQQLDVSLSLSDLPFAWGQEVMAIGYPLPRQAGLNFSTSARLLKGYVTRLMLDPRPGWQETRAYELDLPAPAGVSGAPLLHPESLSVGGVIFGEWGDSEPGQERRSYSFALAHHLDTLAAASGPATDGKSLRDYLARSSPSH